MLIIVYLCSKKLMIYLFYLFYLLVQVFCSLFGDPFVPFDGLNDTWWDKAALELNQSKKFMWT